MATIMATGYTHELIDKGLDFPAFAMNCARAFGACISMNDDAPNAVIPDVFEPSTKFYDDTIASARKNLRELCELEPEQIVVRAGAEQQVRIAEIKERKAKIARELATVETMIGIVNQWEPPTLDHANLKLFMLEQLSQSVRNDDDSFYDAELEKLQNTTPAQWHKAQIDGCLQAIQSAKEGRREEIKRCARRTKWVQQLRKSLDDFASTGEVVCVNKPTPADVAEAMERR